MNSNLTRSKILIIDDDSIITTILTKLLSDKYDTIILNSSTEDYIKILKENNISLILLDVQMPNKDGFDVAKDIKSHQIFEDIPIIFITVNVDEESIIKAFENHASDYVKKPFNKEELKARINAHLTNYENLSKIKKQQDIIYTQSKNTAMKDMLVKISHHWRQPLSAISLVAQSLEIENKMGIVTSESITKTTSEIVKSTKKLSESINFFSELNYNDRYNESQDIALEFAKVIESIKAIYYDDHIDVEYINNFEDKKINVEINIVNLKNVLMNIVANSIEAYEKNKISYRDIKIETYLKEHHIHIMVSDHAGGVDEEILNDIFEPYFSTKANLNGTGLGLFISRNIIENHYNGSVSAKNIKYGEDDGLEVLIEIPVNEIIR